MSHIVSAKVETRRYTNGVSSWLIVKLDDGSVLSTEHGWGCDVWAALDKIRDDLKGVAA